MRDPHDHETQHYTVRLLAEALDQADRNQAFEIYQKTLQCPVCRRIFEELQKHLAALGNPHPRVAPEYTERYELNALLLDIDPEERPERIRDEEILQHWGLATLLLSQSQEALPRDTDSALHLAKLALEIVGHLDPFFYGGEQVLDLEGKVHSWLFECHASTGNLDEAWASFRSAQAAFRQTLSKDMSDASLGYQEARLRMLEGADDLALGQLERTLRDLLHHLQRPAVPAMPWKFVA